jgi:pimeloyl-ACP methyl ester carboxylesterase
MHKWFARVLIASIIILPTLYAGISYYFSSQVVVYQQPENRSDEWLAVYAPDWGIDPTETLTIPVADGLTVVADYYENPLAGDCAILVMHGLGGDRRLVGLYAPAIWNLGCDVLTYDARGMGASDDALLSYGYHEKYDAAILVDWLEDHSDVAAHDIGIMAQSYGAATALQMLRVRDDIGFIIAEAPYSSFERIIYEQANAQFGVWINIFVPTALRISELRADFEVDAIAPARAVYGARTPILLLHAPSDTFTAPIHSELIYAASDPTRTQLIISRWDAVHGQIAYTHSGAFQQAVLGFIAVYAPEFGIQGAVVAYRD